MEEKIGRIKEMTEDLERTLRENISLLDMKELEKNLNNELDKMVSRFEELNNNIIKIENRVVPENSILIEQLKKKYNFEKEDYEKLKKEYSNIITASRMILDSNYRLFKSLSELVNKINTVMNEHTGADKLREKINEMKMQIENLKKE